MTGRTALGLPFAAALVLAACAQTPDPQDVEGIHTSEDGVFRYVDLPGVPFQEAWEAARTIVRRGFAGGPVTEDPEAGTIQLARAAVGAPYRLRFYLRVSPRPDGSRVEVLAEVDELVEDPEPGESPWRPRGERHATLENDLLAAIWNAVHPVVPAPSRGEP